MCKALLLVALVGVLAVGCLAQGFLQVDVCSLPSDSGPCEAAIPSWFFNKRSGACEEFTYGGCQGNGNRFSSREECQKRCGVDVCSLPSDSGPCEAAIPSWFFNKRTGACEEFLYGGCLGNGNRFSSREECQKRCGGNDCLLPSDTGPCKARFIKWFYNSKTERCETFTYGGCQGNGNRFSSQAECKEACGSIPPVGGNPCTLPQDVGPCDGAFPRYYYNSKTRACMSFSFGGCEGNANNFKTLTACQSKCQSVPKCSPQGGYCGVAGVKCCSGLQCCTGRPFNTLVGSCGTTCFKG